MNDEQRDLDELRADRDRDGTPDLFEGAHPEIDPRWASIYCDNCHDTRPLIADVLPANERNDHDVLDLVCSRGVRCESEVGTMDEQSKLDQLRTDADGDGKIDVFDDEVAERSPADTREARAAGEVRGRKEDRIRIIYDLPGDLFSMPGADRLMEIAIFDTLALEPSYERNRLLLEIADAMLRDLTKA